MSEAGGITWLASYPKSGNTWVRLLLGNLLLRTPAAQDDSGFAPVPGISSDRQAFEALVGLSSYDLTDDEIDLLRPASYRMMARRTRSRLFVKAHDAYRVLPGGEPLFPADCSLGAIYIVRDPFDVAVSFAHHRGDGDWSETIDRMNDPGHALSGANDLQMRQIIRDWSGHYRSWIEQSAIPVLVVRYEDLRSDTERELRRIVEFARIDERELACSIPDAVEASRFERLQAIEEKSGFAERSLKSSRFFRSGCSGEGREELGEDLQGRLIEKHGDAMRELGYL